MTAKLNPCYGCDSIGPKCLTNRCELAQAHKDAERHGQKINAIMAEILAELARRNTNTRTGRPIPFTPPPFWLKNPAN